MVARLYHTMVTSLAPIALIACANSVATVAEEGAAVPLGVDLGGSGPVAAAAPPSADHPHPRQAGEMQMTHPASNHAHGSGTVNSVDPAQHKVNLTRAPIPEIGWPTMTMEFPVAPSVDLKAIKPGIRVDFTIEQQPGGMYEIKTISPTGGGR
jgi:Cu(I)/Ag(I) efflux system periplasmic protein CusF